MSQDPRPRGFTIIELMVVIVILVVLSALVTLTASGVQAKNRNGERQTDIDTMRGQLEASYAQNDKYPTLANLQDANWRIKNLSKLDIGTMQDPRWSKTNAACSLHGQPTVASQPTPNCYSYQVKASNGSACDNKLVVCAHYTLTAQLEGGEAYVKNSLN